MKFLIPLIIILLAVGGFLVFQNIQRQEGLTPTKEGAETIIQTDTGTGEPKEIMITDSVKHSIPLNEIISGGPPKDGIPSIDDPKFVSVGDAGGWLSDEEP